MAYPYGTQGAPAVGVGLPGLPRRVTALKADTTGFPALVRIVRLDEVYRIPDWATFVRVTAIGKGGKGLVSSTQTPNGGGGGGLAGTNIERVSPGTVVNTNFTTTATIVSFLNYQLSGGNGGDATIIAVGAAGLGSGGAVNFNGGTGGTGGGPATSGGGGGGAAGRGGNGANGGNTSSSPGGTGGNGGPGIAGFSGGAGGGGGQPNTTNTIAGRAGFTQSIAPVVMVGMDGNLGLNTAGNQGAGGDGGGGSGGMFSAGMANTPGAGLVVIELW